MNNDLGPRWNRAMLIAVARLYDCEMKETDKSVFFGDRRFVFDDAGEIIKIFDYREKLIYEKDIARPLKVAFHSA